MTTESLTKFTPPTAEVETGTDSRTFQVELIVREILQALKAYGENRGNSCDPEDIFTT